MLLAFLATAIATKQNAATIKNEFPIFRPQWWRSQSRLDIRPVCWSLRNRPADWEITEYTLDHKPSSHRFWIANGFWFYRLYETNCGCQKVRGGRFSFLQKIEFHSAKRTWVKWNRGEVNAAIAETNKHFREHFITPSPRKIAP